MPGLCIVCCALEQGSPEARRDERFQYLLDNSAHTASSLSCMAGGLSQLRGPVLVKNAMLQASAALLVNHAWLVGLSSLT